MAPTSSTTAPRVRPPRHSAVWLFGLLFTLSAASVVLLLLLRHEPRSYTLASIPAGQERTRLSREFVQHASPLLSVVLGSTQEWGVRLTQEQINAWFAEDFKISHLDEPLIEQGIHEPRVTLEPGLIRLAFRWGDGLLSTVISIDLGVWLATEEPNVVLVEIKAIHAGAIPVSTQSLLERISNVARDHDIEVNWYRHNGNPTALLRFSRSHSETTAQLHSIKIEKGALVIQGRPIEPRQGGGTPTTAAP